MKKSYIIIGSAGVAVAAILVLVLLWMAPAASREMAATIFTDIENNNIFPYRTVTPVPKNSNASRVILGTVISNEIANVYPRREGIVKDILVDVGDTVRAGQVLAVLLPPGVDGQGAAMIGEKQAYVARALADLEDARAEAALMIQDAKKMFAEKVVALKNSDSNNDVLVREATSALKTMEENEIARKNRAVQEFKSTQLIVSQLLDQADVAVSDARRIVEQILVGKNWRRDQKQLNISDIPSEFSATNPVMLEDMMRIFNNQVARQISVFDSASLDERAEYVQKQLLEAHVMLETLRKVLKETITSDSVSPGMLTDMLKDANEGQMQLLSMKERIQDTINMMHEKERMLREIETGAEKNIEAARKNLEKMSTMKDTELRMLTTEVELLQKQLELTEKKQQQNINKAHKDLEINRAMLSVEYTSSGNTQIVSPFSGIIAKRNIQVGESAGPSMAAFELTGVKTTLSQKAKREIEFGLPEDLNPAIAVGETVTFFVPGNETQTFNAVVTRKSPKIDAGSRTFIMRAKLDDSMDIPHNTVVRLRLQNEAPLVYMLPTPSIVREDGNNFVWELMPDGEVTKKPVNVLAGEGEFSDVTGDFTPDTQILIDPVHLTTMKHAE